MRDLWTKGDIDEAGYYQEFYLPQQDTCVMLQVCPCPHGKLASLAYARRAPPKVLQCCIEATYEECMDAIDQWTEQQGWVTYLILAATRGMF